MRKRISTLVAAAIVGAGAYSQETAPVDSLKESKELQEVVVVGANQRAKPGELTFIPTDRQKKASADGYELLRHMAMPQISVNPASDNVTTVTGGGVSMFINGMPASDIEIKNLRTKNVVRIEYLDFPSDLRFGGAHHALNFIVQLPEWGGYTRLSAAGSFFNNFAQNANVFSKFIYKRMSYDLFLGWRYNNAHHLGYEKTDYYTLLSNEGSPYVIAQQLMTDYSRQRAWGLPINFRATYNTNNFQAQNTISFNYNNIPENTVKGNLLSSNIENDNLFFRDSNNSLYKNVGWEGNFNLYVNHGLSFRLWGKIQYDNNQDNRQYETNLISSHDNIVTNSDEDAWYGGFNLRMRKQINQYHSLSVDYFTNIHDYDIKYTGTSIFNTHMRNTNIGGGMDYHGYFPCNLRLYASIGLGWNRSNSNGQTAYRSYPAFIIDASYTPTPAHQLNLNMRLSSGTDGAAHKTTDILQKNDFIYITGNPKLKDYTLYQATISYTWFTNNKISFTAFANYASNYNKVAPYYVHYLDGKAILQSYHNSGDAYFGTLGVKATYKPFRSFQVDFIGAYAPCKITGALHRSIKPFTGQLNALYYVGNFSFSLSGGLASRSLNSVSGSLMHYKPYYLLRGGWSSGNWNVNIYANNIFNSSWAGIKEEMVYPLYSQRLISRDGSYHRTLSVNVSYTFDYGKKVKHEDEIKAAENNNSAILK